MTELINLTGLQNATTIYETVVFANSVTNQLIGFIILVGMILIIILGLLRSGYSFNKSLLAASFAGFIISVMLRYIGLISAYYMFFVLILLAISAFFNFFSSD